MPKEILELPSTERLHKLFEYHAETGNLIRKISNNNYVKIGEVVGSINKVNGYRSVSIDGRLYQAHRLIWKMVRGEIPTGMFIDHVNGMRDDNRLENLRLATDGENKRNRGAQSNNTSGFKGVSFHKPKNKFVAQIQRNGKQIHLGYFTNPEEAYESYREAAAKYHGEFARVA